jgi:predicted O-methyltransferase YrrM
MSEEKLADETARGRDALTWLEPSDDVGFFGPVPRFRVGEIEFHCDLKRGSVLKRFYIGKNRRGVEGYLEVLDSFPGGRIVELGIGAGGSVALAALATSPMKLVAVELDENRVEALDQLLRHVDLTGRICPRYGVDQADRTRLRTIIDEEFADQPLDLVIDDASHRLDETRSSFETLFPRLRPGGLFLIEDWNHQHLVGHLLAAALTDPDPKVRARLERHMAEAQPQPPLMRLIIELVLAQAESDEFLSGVMLDLPRTSVRRGSGHLDASEFRLSDLFTDHLGLLP